MTDRIVLESTAVKRMYDAANLLLLFLVSYTVYSTYSKLPERIPTHFNFFGRPDSWGGRGSFIFLAAFAWGLTLVFYALIRYMPRIGRNPRTLNIPHKEEFLKLPEQKQLRYWALFAEFMAGLMAAVNLLLYLVIRATARIGMGEAAILPLTYMLPALLLIAFLSILYVVRLARLPGKLIRGED